MNSRVLKQSDIEAVVSLWHQTKREAYTYLPLEQEHTLDDDLKFFREHLLSRCKIWVAQCDGEIAGFLAMSGEYIDRLYVNVDSPHRFCTELFPKHLRLHTLQKKPRAKAFYENHLFRAVTFGISSAPECEPDVE